MRIRVIDVLDLLAAGLTQQQVLEELPDLEAEDISACLRFASSRLNHPILAAEILSWREEVDNVVDAAAAAARRKKSS